MKKRLLRTLVFLVPIGLVAVFGTWCIAYGYRLSRERVAVERTWQRVVNTYRHRLSLVPDFVLTAGGARTLERSLVDRVQEAANAASECSVSPGMLEDTTRFEDFRKRHAEVDRCASDLLGRVGDTEDGTLHVLSRQLLATGERLRSEEQAFSDAVERYNGTLERFPGRMIGSVMGMVPVLPETQPAPEPPQPTAQGSSGEEEESL